MTNRDPLFDEHASDDPNVVDELVETNADAPDIADRAADENIERTSEGLRSVADALRQQGDEQGGKTAEYAAMAADRLDEASGYLHDKRSGDLLGDLEDLVRRKPLESFLAAAGIGLLLSRIVK